MGEHAEQEDQEEQEFEQLDHSQDSSGAYPVAHSQVWCNHQTLFDNMNDDFKGFDTQAKCEANQNCEFMLWGQGSSGQYRCATFQACNARVPYEDGEINVYNKAHTLEASYVVAHADKWCADRKLFDNCLTEGCSTKGYTTQARCEAQCNENADCNFIVWGWNPAGSYYRCAGFKTCNNPVSYNDGDPNVYAKGDQKNYNLCRCEVYEDGASAGQERYCRNQRHVERWQVVEGEPRICKPFTQGTRCNQKGPTNDRFIRCVSPNGKKRKKNRK